MAEERVAGPASYVPSTEARCGKTIPEWRQILRESPGFGTAGQHTTLVSMDLFGMGHGHANALIAHTLREDQDPDRPDRTGLPQQVDWGA